MVSKEKNKSPKICEGCTNKFIPRWTNQKFCDLTCSGRFLRTKLHERKSRDGRLIVRRGIPFMFVNGNAVAIHRLVYEQDRNVKLNSSQHVYWYDEDKNNTRPENLYLIGGLEDCIKIHRRLPRVGEFYCQRCKRIVKEMRVDFPNSGQHRKYCAECFGKRNVKPQDDIH